MFGVWSLGFGVVNGLQLINYQ